MPHETVPADIAAAIDALVDAEHGLLSKGKRDADAWCEASGVCHEARTVLDGAILHHLHNYAELKAALEMQTSGGA